MAESDPRICNIYDINKVVSYSNAYYDVEGHEPFLFESVDEEVLRHASLTQAFGDLLEKNPGAFQKFGVAKLRVIPSDPTKVIDGCKLPITAVENRLLDLFGEYRDMDFITGCSSQHVAFQDEENGYKLPSGLIEVYAEQQSGRMTMQDYFQLLHHQKSFAPLTGIGGDILGTFWETMEYRPNVINALPPLYAVDLRVSPTHASNWAWDLSNPGKDSPLTNILMPCLKRAPGYQWVIPGVHTPLTYASGAGSFFAYHEEDMNLVSINIHLGGYPKVWYVIRPRSVVDLRAAVKYSLKKGYEPDYYHNKCLDPLRHRCFMFSPNWLREWGIHYDVVVQKPFDILFTLGLGGHQGVNLGPCINEAVNICCPEWLEYGKRSTYCNCGYTNFDPVDFSLLPFVSVWETEEKGKAFILGNPEGNTVIKSADEGFFPGSGSKVIQSRYIKSMNKNRQNRYMFKLLKDYDFVIEDNEDRPPGTYYKDGRNKSIAIAAKYPKHPSDIVDEEIMKVFGIDEDSLWERSCKSLEEFFEAEEEAKQKKLHYLAETGRKSIFEIRRPHVTLDE